MTIARVDWFDPRAVALRDAMDVEMGALYADTMAARSQADSDAVDLALRVDPATITETLLALDDGIPVGHTALRPSGTSLEVKRVIVVQSHRGRGIAKMLMAEAETIARARGVASIVLQTGPLQHGAVALYRQLGYESIPPFGPYVAMPFGLCFEKVLAPREETR